MKKRKTYLVTGGAGFIGTHLVNELLNRKHIVYILDNLSSGKRENVSKKAKLIVGDIRDTKLVTNLMRKVDGCFHLAAILSMEQGKKDWLGTHSVNMTGTIQIFNAARVGKNKKPIPVIYASSCAVYGDIPIPLKEKYSIPEPITAYGADKLACEHHARVATFIHEVPTTGLRIFNVYGPGQNPSSPYAGVISKFIDCTKHDKPMQIFDGGTDTRDFVYIKDVVNFFIVAMEKQVEGEAKIYNVATGKAINITALAKLINKLCKKNIKPRYVEPRKGDIPNSKGDPKLAFRELGINTQYDLEAGLRTLLAASKKR